MLGVGAELEVVERLCEADADDPVDAERWLLLAGFAHAVVVGPSLDDADGVEFADVEVEATFEVDGCFAVDFPDAF